MASRKGSASDTPYHRLYRALGGTLPQLGAFLVRENPDMVSLTLKQRGVGDWLAVLKAFDADGGPIVCFGTGFDVVGCLLGLEGALAANRWRVDKPWEGG